MLDVFLEVLSERTKQASADDRRQALLARLPIEDLKKIADGYGVPKEANDGCSWLDKFRGTPLLDEAIAIEKEELDLQMKDNERQRAMREMNAEFGGWDESNDVRSELSIRRRLLDLELAGADMSSPDDAELEDEPAMPPAATPDVNAEAAAEEAAADAPPLPEPKPKAPPAPVAGGQEGEDAAPPEAAAEGAPEEDKPKPPPKPATTKVTKETVEKPAEEKIDVKAAAARLRFALATKEAQPANRAGSFRR